MFTVNLLGKFQIAGESAQLGSEELRSDMLLKLIVYMLLHRDRVVPIQELTEALWDEDETDNPAGALKNLMYRLRTVLKKKLGDTAFISTAHGGYFWNPDAAVVLDTEEFERDIENSRQADRPPAERVLYLEKAVELYRGDFVQQVTDRYWGITTSVYYHSMFLEAVHTLARLYGEQSSYDRMRETCEIGLRYDAVDEELNCMLIRALIRTGKRKAAMERYENARASLREHLGVSKSEHLDEVYRELLAMSGEEVAKDIDSVSREMAEEKTCGAFFCGYQVFREIYRLEARKVGRLGESVYIVLLTLGLKGSTDGVTAQMEKFMIGKAMDQLREALRETLRIGDVVAQYSERQYVLMLPTCTYESSRLVTQRILNNFRAHGSKTERVTIRAEYEEVADVRSALVK